MGILKDRGFPDYSWTGLFLGKQEKGTFGVFKLRILDIDRKVWNGRNNWVSGNLILEKGLEPVRPTSETWNFGKWFSFWEYGNSDNVSQQNVAKLCSEV
ncbi:unnamed protein product [Rhizophagus irregularis]|uniref:Uncharacterized protein n=1 Tax=Rhizophagus irregularis TaxID=588596 RepID=A0A915ZXX0_9GLOM|nr:unnamed protein product [Rhizophagus irregularis]